jgi:hypothetical protein
VSKNGKRATKDQRDADPAAPHTDQWLTTPGSRHTLIDLVGYAITEPTRAKGLAIIGTAVAMATCVVLATVGLVLYGLGLRVAVTDGTVQIVGGGTALGTITVISALVVRGAKGRAARRKGLTRQQRSMGK